MYFELTEQGIDELKKHIKTIDKKDDYRIEIVKKEKIRSEQQNRYYWGAVLPAIKYFSKECYKNFTIGDFHEHIKLTLSTIVEKYNKYLYDELLKDGSVVKRTHLSTQFDKMSQREYNKFLDYIIENIEIYTFLEVYSHEDLVKKYAISCGCSIPILLY